MNDVKSEFGTVREESGVFDRMFAAVEKVRERLNRTCHALESAGIPYAVIGGNAVAAFVGKLHRGRPAWTSQQPPDLNG